MEPGQEIIVKDNRTNTKLFGGYIKDVTRRFIDKNRYVEFCGTQDYSKLIANVVDGVTADYTAGASTEKEILTALFAAYCSSISVGAYVITGNNTAINFENSSLRRAIDELAAVEGRKWYVDSDKRLHYFASTGETAPFGLSDSPNQTTTFDYGNLEYTTDENGDITGTLKCWRGGLYAGMAVAITCASIGWSAQSYIITEVDTRLVSGSLSNTDIIAEYTVSFGTILKSQISNEIIRSGRVITTARIADLAVTNAKIEDCSISKLTAGDISVTGTLISGGKFQTAVSPNPRIEISDTLIAGYSDATTKQFYLQASDGKAYAGAGTVVLNSDGIKVSGVSGGVGTINFYDGSNNLCGYLYGYTNTDQHLTLLADEGLVLSAGGTLPALSVGDGNIYLLASTGVIISTGGNVVRPANAGLSDLGTVTYYWNNIMYKVLVDCGCPVPSVTSPIEAIKKIKTKFRRLTLEDVENENMGSRAKDRVLKNPGGEFEELDLDSFPEELLLRPTDADFKVADEHYKADIARAVEKNKNVNSVKKYMPKVGLCTNDLVYLQTKAIQELINRVEMLEAR